jgi:hypothetical protein
MFEEAEDDSDDDFDKLLLEIYLISMTLVNKNLEFFTQIIISFSIFNSLIYMYVCSFKQV